MAKRDQFLIGEAVAGFDLRANCDAKVPSVTSRAAGATFESKWAGVVNTSWLNYSLHSAYVPWPNDGEDAGIAPADPVPPHRGIGYASCGGRLPRSYATYAPLDPYHYVDRNAEWAMHFRNSRGTYMAVDR